MPDRRAALRELAGRVAGAVISDTQALGRYRGDASHLREEPLAAVQPRDRDDVVELIRWARRNRVPLVARGAGTSLDGESVPAPGGVVVDFSGWDTVHELDVEERWVRVGPGIVNRTLQRHVEPFGLFFPPNPGSWEQSTIGGNAATNASGPRSFRYGAMRRWVLAAEAVTGEGELLSVGNRSRKRSTGPDLLQLLLGSEGTLAFFTELTLALAPTPPRRSGVVVPLPLTGVVGSIVLALARDESLGLSALEYLDVGSATLLSQQAGSRLPSGTPLLLLEVESEDEPSEALRMERLLAFLARYPGIGEPTMYPEANALWSLRGRSNLALDQRFGQRIREDIAVPLRALDSMIETVHAIAERYEVSVYLFGHFGEASLHPNYVIDPASPKATELRRDLLRAAHALGGTISGEHGIGRLKAPYLPWEIGAVGVDLVRKIQRAFDPDGILNPGKIVPNA